ncbi:DNA polymerase I [Thermoanaerobacter thermohydrosulfuricus]|uniref:DNA polymerase I n=2 Tax=Thermoanaerobacter thermohydrosulfuricus TaxID=1516 RepID=M8CWF8_THETY|nr:MULTISPECIES: DNA polymerase I [Thermoanaerobacter]EMT38699.1 DNA polymerase I [Thermoanaerobacter thermohydrosulfuricus WC1]UZQ83828.1 DNA polymerase I [Thermoanaerobacter sp. RKWS2]SDF49195.1 DNA polymerase I [Thermoanaerobacter thermohydrosulfuricus]SFE51730.1 DNA polymerase I [Thermoanaerobacter thermohydrosulfuricus]
MSKFLVIDGSSLMYRAYYALPMLTTSEGLHTNALYGFTMMLIKLIEEEKPDYIAIAFDKKAPTFRHKEYQDYKATRQAMPEELAEQVDLLKEIIDGFNIKTLELEGYEADDIIGTISKLAEEKGMEVLVVTGDRDALQLVSDKVKVKISKKGITQMEEFDEKAVLERYEITPYQFIDLKGLMGDKSDNIPGIPNIGEKTAIKLLKEFGSVENLLQNLSQLKGKIKENIENNKELAVMSKRLSTIKRDIPIEIDFEEYRVKDFNEEKLLEIFNKLEFFSLIDSIKKKDNVEIVNNHKVQKWPKIDIRKLITLLQDSRNIAFYPLIYEGEIKKIAFSFGSNTVYIDIFQIEDLKEIFEKEEFEFTTHEIKDFLVKLSYKGIECKSKYIDTAIMAYLLNPSESNYDLDRVLKKYLKVDVPSYEEVFGKGRDKKKLEEIREDVLADYICSRCVHLFDLREKLMNFIEEMDMKKLLLEIEMPLVEVLKSMEVSGFTLDKEVLKELSQKIDDRIAEILDKIYKEAGYQFNVNSPKQLSEFLFEKLNLPVIKKTKTGYSTDSEVLEQLVPYNDVVSDIIEYRQLTKLKSTYIDGFLPLMDENNRVHSNFKQMVTATGRISSTEPNLQNIPIREEFGRQIRRAFIPRTKDGYIVSADYSQIELRVLAHVSGDEKLIESFMNNEDIHLRTAAEVFKVPMEKVTPEMRRAAKAVNFGIIYGISDYGLSRDLKISRKEAKEYINNYFERYKGVKEYIEKIVRFAKENGYVTTIMNRRRYIPEINSRNFTQRSQAERLAMNAPIQGSAADIIKMAMVKVYEDFKKLQLKSQLILQVHDELVVDTYKDEVDIVKKILKENMENVIKLKVPLVVEIGIGPNWFLAK